MTLRRLLLRNLFFHWRGNLAVLLGVAVGTAVLAGALFVGDSLRGSLRERVVQRLAWVDHALVSNHFMSDQVAEQLSADKKCAAIVLQGSVSTDPKSPGGTNELNPVRRAGKVTILGVSQAFEFNNPPAKNGLWDRLKLKIWGPPSWDFVPEPSDWFWRASTPQLAVSAALARDLGIKRDDEIVLHLPKASAVPRETLLGHSDVESVVTDLKYKVTHIINEDRFGSRFSLTGNPDPPRNVYLPLKDLQAKLGEEGHANAIFVGGPSGNLETQLSGVLDLEDWGLTLRDPVSRTQSLFKTFDPENTGLIPRTRLRNRVAQQMLSEVAVFPEPEISRGEVLDYYVCYRNYLSLESRQTFIEPAVAKAALDAAQDLDLRAAPTLVYLADSISAHGKEIPYSIVAALDPSLPAPLGPFLPEGVKDLKDDEIVLVGGAQGVWTMPLRVKPGDEITVSYFYPEEQRKLTLRKTTFRLRGIIPLRGVAADTDLTPEFPGVTDRATLGKWENPPFDFDDSRVKRPDEQFWNWYRTTPKAYVTLATGQKLWGSRFGNLTSIRFAPKDWQPGADLNQTAKKFRERLRSHLRPEDGGFVFDPVLERGLQATTNGTDFSGYFVGFSFFLIVAALLLVGLLFRLNIDRRADEIGLLLAAGYRRRTVRWLLLLEGALLSAVGALVGLGLALFYAWSMLELLRSWWPGSLDRSLLHVHTTMQSFLLGFAASLAVSVLTILWAVRILGRMSPRALLSGQTTEEQDTGVVRRQPFISWGIAGTATVAALVLLTLGWFVNDHELQASSFFGGGALLLTASLAAVWAWLRGKRYGHVRGQGTAAIVKLGMRNATRFAVRSLLTVGLLASAAFMLIAAQCFHREPARDMRDLGASSGGFLLVAESDVPVFQDFNSLKGRLEMLAQLRSRLQDQRMDNEQIAVHAEDAANLLRAVHFYPLRLRTGDDTSCLNLSEPRRPRLLGVPRDLVERGGFRFAGSSAHSGTESKNPWLLLDETRDDGTIPAIVDATTAQWILHKGIGGKLQVPDETGQQRDLRIVGLLQDSIFQSEVLISEKNFLALYPTHQGYNYFLVDTASQSPAETKALLETTLAKYGIEVTTTADRVKSFLDVENTYLATFQMLGGLGLLLGTLGLGVVLLRGIWERRGELALLRALGYRRSALSWLVLAENGFLLLLGLGIGTVAALMSVAPLLAAGSGEVPWVRLMGMLFLVLLVGVVTCTAATAAGLRVPLLPALRRE